MLDHNEWRIWRARRFRLQLAILVTIILVGLFTIFLSSLFQASQVVRLAGGTMVVVGVGGFLGLYLRGDFGIANVQLPGGVEISSSSAGPTPMRGADFADTRSVEQLSREMAAVRKEVARLSERPVDAAPGDRSAVITALRQSIPGDVATELEQRFAADAVAAEHIGTIRNIISQTSVRLQSEILALGRRANLNLIIGVITTLLAVGVLVYMVLIARTNFDSFTDLSSHYVPRITTVIFIEVFSFFFLRLYKSSLMEIKYYQNELTTLAAQQVALEASRLSQDTSVLGVVLEGLVRGRRADDFQDQSVTEASELPVLTEHLERVTKLIGEAAKNSKR
jgi:hypothetical protein